jgi:uncharacterized cupin superfamily protein
MSLRDKLVRNFNELPLEASERPPLYAGRSARVIGPRVEGSAARGLGASFDIVPPGRRSCPYHFHYAEEEMFIVLEGSGTLRVAGEMIPIRAGDVIDIPPGPEYPHQIINTSDAPLKYLSISTQQRPEICEYPDSGKYLAMTGDARGILAGGRMHRADADLDYWDGEP